MSFYEQVCEILAKEAGYQVARQHKILGEVSREVTEYLQDTLHRKGYIPNREEEIKKIAELAGTGTKKSTLIALLMFLLQLLMELKYI